MIEDHGFEFGEDGTANCNCGWGSALSFNLSIEAEEAWSNHCEHVFMEATGD